MNYKEDLINKLREVIASDVSESLKAIRCAILADEYADLLYSEYVKVKIKAINDTRKKVILQSLNRKKNEKDLLLRWQQGIKVKRQAAMMSLTYVGEQLSVTKQSVHKWELCISKIPVNKALSLADLLNYPISVNY